MLTRHPPKHPHTETNNQLVLSNIDFCLLLEIYQIKLLNLMFPLLPRMRLPILSSLVLDLLL